MSPHRIKTYGWLFIALSLSVFANLLMFQPKPVLHGAQGAFRDSAAGGGESRIARVATVSHSPRSADQVSDTVRAIQRELQQIDFYPGQVDGKPSMLTHAAIVAFEQAQAMPLTGEPTQTLLRALIVGPATTPQPASYNGFGVAPGSAAERLMKEIRTKLVALGYPAGSGDGRLSVDLIRGIRAFEADAGIPQTGRVTAQLLLRLQRNAAAFKSKS